MPKPQARDQLGHDRGIDARGRLNFEPASKLQIIRNDSLCFRQANGIPAEEYASHVLFFAKECIPSAGLPSAVTLMA